MRLRNLEKKDAPLMLEWMHDKNVVSQLRTNFLSKTMEDAVAFIEQAKDTQENLHLAIVSDEDEYMGTVSLKNVNYDKKIAEFGITVRAEAMTHGYAWFGMRSILEKAFSEFNLDCVYWCVSRQNKRAVRFYDKHNFHETLDISPTMRQGYEDIPNLKWYSALKGDVWDNRDFVAGCKVLHIKTVPTLDAGELSFFQEGTEIPFQIKRVYYISKVPEGVRRGFHAHRNLKQLLFCPYGRIQLILENKDGREEIELSDPSIGVLIEDTVWREMLWLEKNSVLCVAASELYDSDDYIRDYQEFKNTLVKKK